LLHSLDIGKYGRVIGEIYIAGKNVNKLLVSEGYAISAEY
jgi:endonuclease YncB( thermonuclease family)